MGLLVVIEEDAGEGVEVVRVAGEAVLRGGEEEALLVGLREQRIVALDELQRPEGVEGAVVDGESFGGVAATVLEQGLGG